MGQLRKAITYSGWLACLSIVVLVQLGVRMPDVAGEGPPDAVFVDATAREKMWHPPHDEFVEKHLPQYRSRVVLWTDKPVYWAGEVIATSAAQLNSHTHVHIPVTDEHYVTCKLLGPSDDEIATTGASGTTTFGMRIPKTAVGGLYKLVLSVDNGKYTTTAERQIEVRVEQRHKLKLSLEFLRQGYAPGDTAEATLTARSITGDPATGAHVVARIYAQGQDFGGVDGQVGVDGKLFLRVPLPESGIDPSAPVTLSASVTYDGVTESTSLTVPLLTSTLDVAILPESGELVDGLRTAVYIEATTPWGEPADMEGAIHVVGSTANTPVATVTTAHEGRGRSTLFTPHKNERYELRTTKPTSLVQTIALPHVQAVGAHIGLTEQVYPAGGPILLNIAASTAGTYSLIVSRMELPLAESDIQLEGDGKLHPVSVAIPLSAVGVLRATLHDSTGRPITERLLFVRPSGSVEVDITAFPDIVSPRSTVQLSVSTSSPDATLWVSVVDESALDMPQPRRRPPRLPQMALLEPEVHDLFNATAYLEYDSEESRMALELLLGIQGWRRFVFEHPATAHAEVRTDDRYQLEHLLAYSEQSAKRFPGFGGGAFERGNIMPVMAMNKMAFAEFAMEGAPAGDGMMMPLAADAAFDVEASGAPPAPAPMPAPPAPPMPEDPADPAMPGKKVAARMFMPKRPMAPRPDTFGGMVWTREFHYKRPSSSGEDYAQTLLWSGPVRTSSPKHAELEFDMSDLITSFRVVVDGITKDGHLFTASRVIASRPPLSVLLDVPRTVRQGDVVQAHAVVRTSADFLEPNGRDIVLSTALDGPLETAAMKTPYLHKTPTHQVAIPLTTTDKSGDALVVVSATAEDKFAKAESTITVIPAGFPFVQSAGGLLGTESPSEVSVSLPNNLIPGTLEGSVTVQLSVLAALDKAVESLISQPHGCFEQTASTTFPMTMALAVLESHGKGSTPMASKAREYLTSGYKTLRGYETSEKGFEWFGQAPGHEALTAYGLLQFHELSEVFDVEKDLKKRTMEWVLSRKDGKAGFARKDQALDSFGRAPPLVTDAYILYALTTILGPNEQVTEVLDELLKKRAADKDPYVTALLANCLYNVDRQKEARQLAEELTHALGDNGSITGAQTSITSSRGNGLQVEATALAVLAWCRDANEFGEFAMRGISFIASSASGGRFGSTQATVLALKAILAFEQLVGVAVKGGAITVTLDGEEVGSRSFSGDELSLNVPLPAERLTPGGEHQIQVSFSAKDSNDKVRVMYALDVHGRLEQPENPENPRVLLRSTLSFPATPDDVVDPQSVGEFVVEVENPSTTDDVSMPVAIIGLPGGVEARFDRLRELQQSGAIAYFELIGDQVVLYWRGLHRGERKSVRFDVVARYSGQYGSQPSVAYPYYEEVKYWVQGPSVHIG